MKPRSGNWTLAAGVLVPNKPEPVPEGQRSYGPVKVYTQAERDALMAEWMKPYSKGTKP